MRKLLTQLLERLKDAWCRLRHDKISMPVNGKYKCWTCLREFSSREAIPETLVWTPDPNVGTIDKDLAELERLGNL